VKKERRTAEIKQLVWFNQHNSKYHTRAIQNT